MLHPRYIDYGAGEPFDAAKWRANAGSRDAHNPRGPRVDDLLSRDILEGRSRAEVVSLLGPPESQRAGADGDPTGSHASWAIGAWNGLGIDDNSFEVDFDGNGRALRAYWLQN